MPRRRMSRIMSRRKRGGACPGGFQIPGTDPCPPADPDAKPWYSFMSGSSAPAASDDSVVADLTGNNSLGSEQTSFGMAQNTDQEGGRRRRRMMGGGADEEAVTPFNGSYSSLGSNLQKGGNVKPFEGFAGGLGSNLQQGGRRKSRKSRKGRKGRKSRKSRKGRK